LKFLFFCFVFSFLTINSAYSQKAQSGRKDLAYFGNISEEVMNMEQATNIVKNYYDKKLQNSTRRAVIVPSGNGALITVNIVEIDGSPFYSFDIDRKSGKVVNDPQYERYQKIQDDLQKKRQEAMERAALRSKYQETLAADDTQKTDNVPVNNVKSDTNTSVSEQPQQNNPPPRRRRRRLNNSSQ